MKTITLSQAVSSAVAKLPSATQTPTKTSDWRPTIEAYEPSLEEAARLASTFVADMARGELPRWLTFTGVPGCGKTMLARQIFEAAKPHNPGEQSAFWSHGSGEYSDHKRRPRRVWLSTTDFAARMRSGKEFDLPEYLGTDFLVVLDDLGASRDTTTYLAEAVYRLCNARQGKWTVFTSNLDLRAVATQVDIRVASRLIRDGNVSHRIKAGDYALRQLTG